MEKLKSQIESILFVSAKAMSIKVLAELIEADVKEVEQAALELVEELKNANRGIQVIKNAQSFQMVSSSSNTDLVQKLIKDETTGELSRPSLETLTIIAYRGPISKFDIDRIRGINCSLILRNLLLRGLIETKQEKEKEKDQAYYTVTFDFIRFLGLNDVKELPDFEKLHQDDTLDRVLKQAEEIKN